MVHRELEKLLKVAEDVCRDIDHAICSPKLFEELRGEDNEGCSWLVLGLLGQHDQLIIDDLQGVVAVSDVAHDHLVCVRRANCHASQAWGRHQIVVASPPEKKRQIRVKVDGIGAMCVNAYAEHWYKGAIP